MSFSKKLFLNEDLQPILEAESILFGADGRPLQVPDEEEEVQEIQNALDYDGSSNDTIFDQEQLDIIEGGIPQEQITKLQKRAERKAKQGDTTSVQLLDNTIKRSNEMNKFTPKERAISLVYQGQSQFGDFTQYGEGFQVAITDSIDKWGWTLSENPFLQLALELTNDGKSSKGVPQLGAESAQALMTIGTMLKNKDELTLSNTNLAWLENTDSYSSDDPIFKVKALTFINGKNADDYGDTKLVPDLTNRIIKEKRKSEIERLLKDWQTKEGKKSREGQKPQTEEEKKQADKIFNTLLRTAKQAGFQYNPTQLRKNFDDNYVVGDTVAQALMDAISSNVLKGTGISMTDARRVAT